MKLLKFKTVTCGECGRDIRVQKTAGEKELLDGWHGECKGPFCGYRYFEEVPHKSPLGENL